jgi:hypothetical protein
MRRAIHKMLRKLSLTVELFLVLTAQIPSYRITGTLLAKRHHSLTLTSKSCGVHGRIPWPRNNIMYSGHLLPMTSWYAMLFDDDEFEKPGGLAFRLRHFAWGFG